MTVISMQQKSIMSCVSVCLRFSDHLGGDKLLPSDCCAATWRQTCCHHQASQTCCRLVTLDHFSSTLKAAARRRRWLNTPSTASLAPFQGRFTIVLTCKVQNRCFAGTLILEKSKMCPVISVNKSMWMLTHLLNKKENLQLRSSMLYL